MCYHSTFKRVLSLWCHIINERQNSGDQENANQIPVISNETQLNHNDQRPKKKR